MQQIGMYLALFSVGACSGRLGGLSGGSRVIVRTRAPVRRFISSCGAEELDLSWSLREG